jgi:hypothetical protein
MGWKLVQMSWRAVFGRWISCYIFLYAVLYSFKFQPLDRDHTV